MTLQRQVFVARSIAGALGFVCVAETFIIIASFVLGLFIPAAFFATLICALALPFTLAIAIPALIWAGVADFLLSLKERRHA